MTGLEWDCEQEESTLYSRLKAISSNGTFTLSLVTAAALSGAFLPGLLPQAWAGQSKIRSVSPIRRASVSPAAWSCVFAVMNKWVLLVAPWSSAFSAQLFEISVPGAYCGI